MRQHHVAHTAPYAISYTVSNALANTAALASDSVAHALRVVQRSCPTRRTRAFRWR